MKKLSIALIGIIFLSITVIAACIAVKPDDKETNPVGKTCYSCTGEMEWVDLDEAVEKVKSYGNNQWAASNESMNKRISQLPSTFPPKGNPFADSRFITFPVDSLKKFICKIEEMIANSGYKKSNGSSILQSDIGIRCYYAAFPGLPQASEVNNTYAGRHTLLLVPTYIETNGIYTEFLPAYISTPGDSSTYDRNTTSSPKPKYLFWMLSPDDYIIRNQGTLCPPPSTCNAFLLSQAN